MSVPTRFEGFMTMRTGVDSLIAARQRCNEAQRTLLGRQSDLHDYRTSGYSAIPEHVLVRRLYNALDAVWSAQEVLAWEHATITWRFK